MSRGYKKGNTALSTTIAILSVVVVVAVGITITGLCLGHTNPINFVLSWFGK